MPDRLLWRGSGPDHASSARPVVRAWAPALSFAPRRASVVSRRGSMSVDLVRIVDSIHRDKNIPKEILFEGIESALATAAQEALPRRRRDPGQDRPRYRPDRGHQGRRSGSSRPNSAGSPPRPPSRSSSRRSARPSATASSRNSRTSGATSSPAPSSGSRAARSRSTSARPTPCCPAASRSPAKATTPTSAIRAVILEVRKVGQRVKIILSRTHPDFVRRLFELEIPEIAGPDHLDPRPGARGRLSLQGRRQLDRLQGRRRRRLRGRARHAHQEHRR